MPANSGNIFVDALSYSWRWQDANLTYFVDDTGAGAWNTIELAALRAAFDAWEAVSNLTFTETANQFTADLSESLYISTPGDLGAHSAWVVEPVTSVIPIANANGRLDGSYNRAGFAWDEGSATGGLQVGGGGFATIVHEIGHAVGLDHTHTSRAGDPLHFPGVTGDPQTDTGENNLNQDIHSIMSYVEGVTSKGFSGLPGQDNYGFVGGPMVFDIATVQFLYGANTTTNSGNDVYVLPDSNTAGTYFAAIWDTAGTDVIQYNGSKNTIIDLRSATLQNEPGGGGFLSQASGVFGGFLIAADFTDALADVGSEVGVIIENATGGGGNDTIVGNAADNALTGNDGTDTLDGGAGNDTLDGGAGADSLDGGGGDDILNIDGADTSFFGDTGTDTVNVLDNSGVNISVGIATRVEIVNGGGGNDTIDATGAATAVTISGLAGNDVITGAGGSDSLFGNGGDDTLTGAAGHDQMFGGAGADSYFGGDGNDRFFVDGDDLVFDGGAGWDRVIVNTTSGTSLTLQDLGIEVAQGNIGNDTIDASAMTTGIQLFGFGGLDTLTGGSGNDFLIGGDDADILNGGGGDDLVFGGAGGDTFDLGAGNDIVWLDAGDTLTDAGAGNDRAFVLDTAGANISIGAANVETVYGNTGNDVIDGSGATVAMLLTGGQGGNDTLTGGTLGDTLIGNDGVDTLVGGAGVDILNAGTGADFLTGGAGNDDLFGLLDGNTDTFIFADGSGRDRVFTWEDGIDLIDLSGHSGASQFSDLTITQVGANTEIDVGADTIVLASINAGTVDATDFVF